MSNTGHTCVRSACFFFFTVSLIERERETSLCCSACLSVHGCFPCAPDRNGACNPGPRDGALTSRAARPGPCSACSLLSERLCRSTEGISYVV